MDSAWHVIAKVILSGIFCLALSAQANVLTSDTFEGSLGNWKAEGGASLYTYGGSGINYATQGDGAVALFAAWDEGILTLKNNLRLDSNQASSVTISFDYEWDTTTATRLMYVDYSMDGGKTWTDEPGDISGWGSFTGVPTLGAFSKTLEEKTVGSFTDRFKFRIRGKNGGNPVTAHIDNIEIIGTDVIPLREVKDDIPEASTWAFIVFVLSVTTMLRSRR